MKLAIALVILAAISHSAALGLGLWIGNEKSVLMCKADSPKLTQACPVPATALTQWSCNAQERREYIHACTSRIRLGKVKGRDQ